MLCGDDAGVGGLSEQALRSHLGLIRRGESRLAARKSVVLAELSRRSSKAEAQRIASEELLASGRDARREVETATQLAELPDTASGLASGEIPASHAHLIARAAGEGPIEEAELAEAARCEQYDEFAKTVRRHQLDRSDDDGEAILNRQRNKRKARIFQSSDSGMFVLQGEFDPITGTRIATALTAKERQLWHNEDPENRRTPQQRMADALAELVCQEPGGKAQGTNLLVIADYDLAHKELVKARLADGTAIPISELRRLACEADVLPSIFNAKSQEMWMGRKCRTATEAQRIALIARDQGCIGCRANPLWCKAHHIIWWKHGGGTDYDNLALVCDGCHHKIHDLGHQVHQHPETRKLRLKPPNKGSPTEPPGLVTAGRGSRQS